MLYRKRENSIAGHNTDTFSMGSLRNELQLPAQFASTGSIEEEDDEDEDIMLMGTTPQVILTSSGNFWQCYNVPCSSVASVT